MELFRLIKYSLNLNEKNWLSFFVILSQLLVSWHDDRKSWPRNWLHSWFSVLIRNVSPIDSRCKSQSDVYDQCDFGLVNRCSHSLPITKVLLANFWYTLVQWWTGMARLRGCVTPFNRRQFSFPPSKIQKFSCILLEKIMVHPPKFSILNRHPLPKNSLHLPPNVGWFEPSLLVRYNPDQF
jgi:hypothetical protein